MKRFVSNLLRAGALVLTFLLGTLPLLLSFILGLAIRPRGLAYGLALGLTLAITLLPSESAETLRFGPWGLRLLHHLSISGAPSLLGSLSIDLAFAVLGVSIGRAAREGYQAARSVGACRIS